MVIRKVILLSAVILVFVLLAGCKAKNVSEYANAEFTNVFAKTQIEEPNAEAFVRYYNNQIYSFNDRIYLTYYYVKDHIQSTGVIQSFDTNGENVEIEEVCLPPEYGSLGDIRILSDGSYLILIEIFDENFN